MRNTWKRAHTHTQHAYCSSAVRANTEPRHKISKKILEDTCTQTHTLGVRGNAESCLIHVLHVVSEVRGVRSLGACKDLTYLLLFLGKAEHFYFFRICHTLSSLHLSLSFLFVRVSFCCFSSPGVNPWRSRWCRVAILYHAFQHLKLNEMWNKPFFLNPDLSPSIHISAGVFPQCIWPLRPEEKWAKPRPPWDALLSSMHCCCCSACWSCSLDAWSAGEGRCYCLSRPVTRQSTQSSHTQVSPQTDT